MYELILKKDVTSSIFLNLEITKRHQIELSTHANTEASHIPHTKHKPNTTRTATSERWSHIDSEIFVKVLGLRPKADPPTRTLTRTYVSDQCYYSCRMLCLVRL